MLFTVVESRDARLVAESADRKVKLVLEGPGSGAFPVGTVVGLARFDASDTVMLAGEVVAVGQPAPVVTHDLSDDGTLERAASPITVILGVESDEVPEVLDRSDAEPLAEPAVEQ